MIRGKKLAAPYGRRISLLSGGSSSKQFISCSICKNYFNSCTKILEQYIITTQNQRIELMLITDFKYNATDAFYSAYKYGIKDCAPSLVKDAWACKGVFALMDYNPFTHTSQLIREEYNKLTISLLNGQIIPNGCCELPPTDGSMNPILLACELDQKPWCRYYTAKPQVWKHTLVPASYPGGLDSVYSTLVEEPTTAPTASPTQGPPSTSSSSATQSQGSTNTHWTTVALLTAGLGALLGGGIYARRRSQHQQELQKANHLRSIGNL